MARIDDVFVSGTLGNLVFYRRMGKACVRMKRTNIRQTQATKKRSENFGIASGLGRILRMGLHATMPEPTNRSMQSRFTGAIALWLGKNDVNNLPPAESVPCVSSFSFTDNDGFYGRCRIPVTIELSSDGIRLITGRFIPVDKISAPAGTQKVIITFDVTTADLLKMASAGYQTHHVEVAYSQDEIPAKHFDFRVGTSKGTLVVTAARIQYVGTKYGQHRIIENRKFNPAGVIDARYF